MCAHVKINLDLAPICEPKNQLKMNLNSLIAQVCENEFGCLPDPSASKLIENIFA